jgi:hypothetical protein
MITWACSRIHIIVGAHASARKRCRFAHTRMKARVHTHTHTHAHTCTHRRAHTLAHTRAKLECAQVHGLPVPSARRRKRHLQFINEEVDPPAPCWEVFEQSMELSGVIIVDGPLDIVDDLRTPCCFCGIHQLYPRSGVCKREGSPTSVAGPDRARKPALAAPLSCRQHP